MFIKNFQTAWNKQAKMLTESNPKAKEEFYLS